MNHPWCIVGKSLILPSQINVNTFMNRCTRDGALFRSSDHGQSTENINHDAIISNVSHIAINPQNPNIIYTSDYRSADGGATWSRMNGGGAQYAINPLDPRTILVTRYLSGATIIPPLK
jgi:hypothetical protein